MMRSLYSGVSGLNNHQTKMDVIGNNISNVNTFGFKKGRATFQDILSQTMAGASKPQTEKGGVNPKQVGLGMSIAAIDTIHTQGALQTTGVNTDVAIQGEGFFIQKAGSETVYSRNGAFGLDANGYLVNPANGFKVQGYGVIENPDGTTTVDRQAGLADLIIPRGEKIAARATQNIAYRCNLDSRTPAILDPDNATAKDLIEGTWRASIDAYDSKGNNQKIQLNFQKFVQQTAEGPQELDNVWTAEIGVEDLMGRDVQILDAAGNPLAAGETYNFTVAFNPDGSIRNAGVDLQPDADGLIPAGADNAQLTIPLNYQIPGSDNVAISLDVGEVGDYTGITQSAANSTTKAFKQDGYAMGILKGFQIDNSGVITGTYSNGIRRPVGQLGLATFMNPGGLEKEGDNFYSQSINSGRAQVNAPGEQVAGGVQAGMLEMSNVDLASEFSEMITTQRGFQANSRTITTSDRMLEELLRLKR